MEFAFTEEQAMIRDTAAAFLEETSGSAAVREAMSSERGYDPALWRRICTEMCWQAMHIPERHGGLGLGYVELAATLEQMGRRLLCSPFFATVCLGVNGLLVAGSEEQKALYLPRILAGATATLACNGGVARWDANCVAATCKRDGEGFLLSGDYRYVIDGHSAEILILAAREEGSVGADGLSLFVLEADGAGITREALPTMDQARRQAAIRLDHVRVQDSALLGPAGGADAALARILDLATVALAAEQLGGCQQLLDMSVAYAGERVQFDRPIASFQAIKHKAAEMMLKTEVARSAVYYAACVADEALGGGEPGAELPEAASIAKSWCSDAYFAIAGDALQIHGGVGFTWEYDVHLYLKRAKSSEHMFGNAALHRERLAAMLLDRGEPA